MDELENSFQACGAIIDLHMRYVAEEGDVMGRAVVHQAFEDLLTAEANRRKYCPHIDPAGLGGRNPVYGESTRVPASPASYVHAQVYNAAMVLVDYQKGKLKAECERAHFRILSSRVVTRTCLRLAP